MTADWFRTWHGAPTDTKWRTVARRAGVRPGDVWAVVSCLYDRASQSSDRGCIAGYDAEVIADALGFDTPEVEAIVAALVDKGVVADGRIVAWEKYQPKREDGAAERAKAWREAKKKNASNGRETLANATERNRTLDTDTDTDTERVDTAIAASTASAPAADDSKIDVHRLTEICLQEAGITRERMTTNLEIIGPIFDLIKSGWDLQGHILPALRKAKSDGKFGNTWAYYAKIITNGSKFPPKPEAPPAPAAKPASIFDDPGKWHLALRTWRSGTWPGAWGPRPDEPGCRIPPDFVSDWQRQQAA